MPVEGFGLLGSDTDPGIVQGDGTTFTIDSDGVGHAAGGSGGPVTSVQIADSTGWLDVAPTSPATGAVGLSVAPVLEGPHTVLAGPESGSTNGYPFFRDLVPADLPTFAGTGNPGIVPDPSGADTTHYLRADGAFGVPAGTGSGVTSVEATDSTGWLAVAPASPSTGTVDVTIGPVPEGPNTVLAGPPSGSSDANPDFRNLVTADLPDSGVTPGTYGDATHVAQVTVNAEGQVTNAANVAITSAGPGYISVTTLGSDTELATPTFAALLSVTPPAGTYYIGVTVDLENETSGALGAVLCLVIGATVYASAENTQIPALSAVSVTLPPAKVTVDGSTSISVQGSSSAAGVYAKAATESGAQPNATQLVVMAPGVGGGGGGGVTSVEGTDGTGWLAITPSSPATGAVDVTIDPVAQGPHAVLAGPASGSSSADPSFRPLVAADLPTFTGTGHPGIVPNPAGVGNTHFLAADGVFRIPSGTGSGVSSVETTDSTGWLSVGPSGPVSGAVDVTVGPVAQGPHTVLAGPSSGSSSANPGFRDLVAADLPNTAVTPATYGDATHVAQVTVDAQGRITGASNVAISGGGGVSSFDASDSTGILTLTPASPATGAVTLDVALTTQSPNEVFAGPGSGSAATPTFRSLVGADLPASGVTAGTYGDDTDIPVVTVDATGRITSISTVANPGVNFSSELGVTTDGTDTSIDFSSIPTNGRHLEFECELRTDSTAGGTPSTLTIQLGTSGTLDTGSHYYWGFVTLGMDGTTTVLTSGVSGGSPTSDVAIELAAVPQTSDADTFMRLTVKIPYYRETSPSAVGYHSLTWQAHGASDGYSYANGGGMWKDHGDIDEVKFAISSGAYFKAGSKIQMRGLS